MAVIRVGTRGSALALAQTRQIAERLGKAAGADIEVVPVTTHGDTSRASLSQIGGTGVFATALRESLLAGDCDVVVHSLKDLPTGDAEGLRIGAIPKRADARDAVCTLGGRTLAELPEGARVGTGSPRRIAQLGALRPDIRAIDIRGNVDSRLARLSAEDESERLDAVILSAAGLGRLGRADAASELLPLEDWPTAAGQGALALEVRDERGSRELERGLAAVEHATTRAFTIAERGVLAGLEAGCAAPVGATAFLADELLFLTASVYSADGTTALTSSHAATPESRAAADLADAARDVASRVVAELLGNGAADLAPLEESP
ncbi:hydroxymethylbilane synthase [Agromyces archimandritae]|uniref:Hydroxymethylbilane synthase n=1 Tax=Agromyces archimandritae TaxID=2781962 RepID=A0A975FK02_9MICO|nr:hydroxymethylbilane synthase [Agromyces archimandritae]QTX03445.1 hydroxymethylbilane synthase [Agromyces archimandritae]